MTSRSRKYDKSKLSAEVDVLATGALDGIEPIVRKAVAVAMKAFESELRQLLRDKVEEMVNRMSSMEHKFDIMEGRIHEIEDRISTPQPVSVTTTDVAEMRGDLKELRVEAHKSLIMSNDNEQYSRRNNLRLRGLKGSDDCRRAVVEFLNHKLKYNISEADIEAAHPLLSKKSTLEENSGNAGTDQTARPTVIVRFINRKHRDDIIRIRKMLKGTEFSIAEDLTSLNVQTLNRVRNHPSVQSSWSWNGKIHAVLKNGKRISVKPFQALDGAIG
jgi:hypothetical protein